MRTRPTLQWACLMAEALLTLARAAPPRRRGTRLGGPHGHHTLTNNKQLICACTTLATQRENGRHDAQTAHTNSTPSDSSSPPTGNTDLPTARNQPTLRSLTLKMALVSDGGRGGAGGGGVVQT